MGITEKDIPVMKIRLRTISTFLTGAATGVGGTIIYRPVAQYVGDSWTQMSHASLLNKSLSGVGSVTIVAVLGVLGRLVFKHDQASSNPVDVEDERRAEEVPGAEHGEPPTDEQPT